MSTIPRQSTYWTRHAKAPSMRRGYGSYKSRFGPQYTIEPHFHGYSVSQAVKYVPMAAVFGAATGIFALYFFAEVPRIRTDIVEKIPIIGPTFRKEIAPEDNPF